MKKDLGSLLALYPMPATIVGAMVDGRPNWMQVAHVGVIGHDRIIISCMSSHHTNRGIRETGVVSVSLCDRAMLPELDRAGGASGAKVDRSGLLAWSAAGNGAPVPEKAPVLFEFPTYSYYATGERLGACLSFRDE